MLSIYRTGLDHSVELTDCPNHTLFPKARKNGTKKLCQSVLSHVGRVKHTGDEV